MNDYIFIYKLMTEETDLKPSALKHINVKMIGANNAEEAEDIAETFLKQLNNVSKVNDSTDQWQFVMIQSLLDCETLYSETVAVDSDEQDIDELWDLELSRSIRKHNERLN